MKQKILFLLTLLVASVGTQAKSWKIGPSSVTGMDFASINVAMSSSNVNAGDTLYLDQYFSTNVVQTVTKKVVIIGTGYDTSFSDEQVVATLTDSLKLMVDGIQVKSVRLANVKFFADECTLDRCYTAAITIGTVPKSINHIFSCYITGTVGNRVVASSTISYNGSTTNTYANAQFDIQNCVLKTTSRYAIQYLTNSIINNNTIHSTYGSGTYCLNLIDNTQITNNLIYQSGGSSLSSDVYAVNSGNSIEHNIINQSVPTTYPNNKNGSLTVCNQTGNYSDYYKLKTNVTDNYALTYATDGGEVGCHGGMFGCPSGGRPQYIPYFTKVTVGSRTENGKLPVSVTIKIQDE